MNRDKLIQVNGKKEKAENKRLVIQKADGEEDEKFLKKTIQFFSCQPGITYEVKGKCNTVQLMDSKDCTLEVDTVVSGVEITNCSNVTLVAKEGKEFWTCTVNKTMNLTVVLNNVIAAGGIEVMEGNGVAKEFQIIGAAMSAIKVQKKGKSIAIQDAFQFKADVGGAEAKMTNAVYTGKFGSTTSGVEMEADGAGFATSKGKGKTVYVKGKQGKGKDLPLVVKGGANSVVLDGCKRVALSVDNVKTAIEVNNCKQVKISVAEGGKVPAVVVNNSHGCYITLATANPDFVVNAKHFSDMNMNFPHGGESEKVELSMPEQFVFKFEDGASQYSLPTF